MNLKVLGTILLLSFTLTACGGSGSATQDASTESVEEVTTENDTADTESTEDMIAENDTSDSDSTEASTTIEDEEEASAETTEVAEVTEEDRILELTKENYDSLDTVEIKVSGIPNILGLTKEEVLAGLPNLTFMETTAEYDVISMPMLITKVSSVDLDGMLMIGFIDETVVMAGVNYDVSDATELLIGNAYMKIRNTVNSMCGDPDVAYTPSYGEISSSQIGTELMEGKSILEQWSDEENNYVAELGIYPGEDTSFTIGFETLDCYQLLKGN